MGVPPSHAKMCLKSAPQKLNFLMAKGMQKCYTLTCSLKCPCAFLHSYALLRHLVFKKNHFIWNKQHFLQPREPKMRHINSWSLEYIENKYQVTSDSFVNFAYVSSYLHLKDFKRLSNILKTIKAKKFIKTILESTYKVVLGKHNLVGPTQPVSLLRAVDF